VGPDPQRSSVRLKHAATCDEILLEQHTWRTVHVLARLSIGTRLWCAFGLVTVLLLLSALKLAQFSIGANTPRSLIGHNRIMQDHRAIKRITRPMLGFKTFRRARILTAGIEVMHMIRKGQLGAIKDPASSAANQFYSLAF